MKNVLLILSTICMAFVMNAQTVTGKVMDGTNDEPLIGATVLVRGTTIGTVTDFEGAFELKVGETANSIEISYTGFESKIISLDGQTGAVDLGNITMSTSALGLDEVVITGTMDIVRDRRTPVAVSTITAAEIQAVGGNVEFPDIMKSTPSIYVANQAGGYGDSQVFTRGFSQVNTAFLLNGQPINGMEDGRMYWSNWSGMSDVATAIQVQRGLGSSKLAISSVGGTTNIIMKSTQQEQGGTVAYTLGNDGYNKFTASYNTGMMENGLGVTVLLTHWQGNGWAEGTQGQGQNYFISAGYRMNDKHDFNFLLTGAPQWHDQNFDKRISDHFRSGEFNIRYNNNWGMLDGEYLTSRRNYYHKPVANLNWDYKISNNSAFNTVLYASWGRGGGSGGIGNRDNRFFTDEGYWDFDRIVQANRASNGDAEYVLRNSVNNHSWYGVVSRFDTKLTESIDFSIGADLRHYQGSHFREVRDLLGAPAYTQRGTTRFDGQPREVTEEFKADPWVAVSNFADLDQRIAYNNDETIQYGGVFTQLEYSNELISAYVQGAVSNQTHVRFELFNETEANEASEKVANLGYNAKGGLSLSFDENNTVFVNAGYYSRQPFHDNIYLNFSNTVNPVTENEDVIGFEAGYKYANRKFAANVNLYRTAWNNRTTTNTIRDGDVVNGREFVNGGFINLTDVNQLHQGLEIDFGYDITRTFKFKGFASFGNWLYNGDAIRDIYDDSRELISSEKALSLDGLHVGGAAQTSGGLGITWKAFEGFRFNADVYHFSRLYSNLGTSEDELELPAFNLVDLGVGYNFKLPNDQILSLRANLYNALGEEYISRSNTAVPASSNDAENWNGVNQDNQVKFGTTQTWNISARYSF